MSGKTVVKLAPLVTALVLVLCMLLPFPTPARAQGTVYVDDDGACGGNSPCYLHPQDAVNAASPGDTILVYPGTYDSRWFQCPWAPNCSCSDVWSPTVIVYKDNLTIKAVDPDPAETVLQATHTCWSNAIAVQNSTNGGVTGIGGWAPNVVVVVANNATIEGFTFHRPFNCANTNDCFWNTAGVFIGSKGAGYQDFLGHADGALVQNNIFSNVWHAVYIWHSQHNSIVWNTVEALGNTGHWAAIEAYDGYSDAQMGWESLSRYNNISCNTLADKGIGLGAWAPATLRTDNVGTLVCGNTTTQVGFSYSDGQKVVGCNSATHWTYEASGVVEVTDITYTGDTLLPSGTVLAALSAQVTYSSGDGSDIRVRFAVDGATYDATTQAGGTASTTATLTPGVYTVETSIADCECCSSMIDTDTLQVEGPLEITKSVAPPAVDPGQEAVFTIVATNNGPGTAHNVVVTDELDPGLEITSVQTTKGTHSVAAQLVTVNVGTLAVDESVTITIRVLAHVAGAVLNVAQLAALEGEATSNEVILNASGEFVPEAGSLLLLGSGLSGLAGYAALRWRSRRT